jgi:hypothetical protein
MLQEVVFFFSFPSLSIVALTQKSYRIAARGRTDHHWKDQHDCAFAFALGLLLIVPVSLAEMS